MREFVFRSMALVFVAFLAFAALFALVPPNDRAKIASEVEAGFTIQANQIALDDAYTAVDVMLDTYTEQGSHAVTKHAGEALAVQNACGGNPQYQLWIRPSKYVEVCKFSLGWGFRVWQQIGGNAAKNNATWAERTAYIRQEIKKFADLVDFAKSNKLMLKVWDAASQVWKVVE